MKINGYLKNVTNVIFISLLLASCYPETPVHNTEQPFLNTSEIVGTKLPVEPAATQTPTITKDPNQEIKDFVEFVTAGAISFDKNKMVFNSEEGKVDLNQVSFSENGGLLLNMGDLGVYEFVPDDIDVQGEQLIGIAGFKYNPEIRMLEVAQFPNMFIYANIKANPKKFFDGMNPACLIGPEDANYFINTTRVLDRSNHRSLPDTWNGIALSVWYMGDATLWDLGKLGISVEPVSACGLVGYDSQGQDYLYFYVVYAGPSKSYFGVNYMLYYGKIDKESGKHRFLRNLTPDDLSNSSNQLTRVFRNSSLTIVATETNGLGNTFWGIEELTGGNPWIVAVSIDGSGKLVIADESLLNNSISAGVPIDLND